MLLNSIEGYETSCAHFQELPSVSTIGPEELEKIFARNIEYTFSCLDVKCLHCHEPLIEEELECRTQGGVITAQ